MESCDIIWLNQMYFENNLNHEENKNEFQGDEYIDGAEEPESFSSNVTAQPITGSPMITTRSGWQVQPPKLYMHEYSAAEVAAVRAGIGRLHSHK